MKKIFKSFAIILILFFGAGLFMLSNQIGGIRAFTVMSGSMTPIIPTGALVFTKQILPQALSSGDIITFIKPDRGRQFITHRISDTVQKDGIPMFTTRGDANPTKDPWQIAGGAVVGEVVFTIPYLGYILAFAKTKLGLILFILIPSFFILLSEFLQIISLLKSRKKLPDPAHSSNMVLILSIYVLLLFTPVTQTSALLIDSAKLTGNNFNVVLGETNKECPDDQTNVTIENNEPGSTNTVNITTICSIQINQSNTVTSNTNTTSTVSSGGNQSTGNTGEQTILTGNSNSDTTVINTNENTHQEGGEYNEQH
jgi:signal peptidase I